MKNKVGNIKTVPVNSSLSLKHRFASIIIAIKGIIGTKLSSKVSPLLFLNIFVSLSKLMPLKIDKIRGIINRDGSVPMVKEPAIMPSQNIRFQKLSLFSRALIKAFIFIISAFRFFMFTCSGCYRTYILPRIKVFRKQIPAFAISISLVLQPCYAYEALESDADNRLHEHKQLELSIRAAERAYNIPKGLLYSIARVESALRPYVLNVEGKTLNLNSASEAEQELKKLIDKGISNIDIGIMQLNWRWHGHEFLSVREMLNPDNNITYAAKLLGALYKQHGSWHKAIRFYHSAAAEHNRRYSRKVVTAWIAG